MKNMLKTLCLNLAKVETVKEAIDLLKLAGYWDSENHWHPYGQMPGNASIINNQANDSVRSKVEKITNSIDQILILECIKRGIDPEGPEAPKTTKKALEKFLNIPNGDISQLTKSEKTALNVIILS